MVRIVGPVFMQMDIAVYISINYVVMAPTEVLVQDPGWVYQKY